MNVRVTFITVLHMLDVSTLLDHISVDAHQDSQMRTISVLVSS